MKGVIGHPVAFVLLYILFMLPTYILPWLGSNSAVLNASGAASGAGLHPLLWVHLAAWFILVALAWIRGSLIGHGWLVVLPILGAIFDMVPGLNWIFLIPTILNIICIVCGVALKARPPEPVITS